MANKFQKSVLERLEQEADRQKKQKPDSTVQEAKKPIKETAHVPVISERSSQLPTDEKESETIEMDSSVKSSSLPTDIGAFLRPLPQRQAKNKTFYLDGEVITAIKRTAKEQRVTDSKLVNDILRRVLGVDG